MALVATTLSRAHDVLTGFGAKTLALTAATGATTKMIGYVGTECFRITDVSTTPTLGIVPGYTASTGGPWAVGTPVVFGIPFDFNGLSGPDGLSFFTGAITGPGGAGTLPVVDTIIYLTASGAGAYTIALPAADQSNRLIILNATAQAHVLTLTGNPGTSDVATFVAALGGRLELVANFGVWSIAGTTGVVVA